jgi:hypothetical protein
MKQPKDATIHVGELWSPFKTTRVHKRERKDFLEKEQEGKFKVKF